MSDTFRSKMASLPFSEKIKILEQMLDRERLIAPIREKLKAERMKQEEEENSK